MSKNGQREVSSFMGHELLYDYLCDKLDDERKKAVEEHIKFSRDAQLDFSKIQSGQSYAERLADTVVSQPIIEQINFPSTYMSVLLQKSNFEKWPVGLKWGLEALVVVFAIVILLTVAPWEKVMKMGVSTSTQDVVLAEITKDEKPTTEVVAKVEADSQKFMDEVVTPTPAIKPSPGAAKVAATQATATQESTPLAASEEPNLPKAESGGFLYRGNIYITNIDMAGPKISEKITALGGRKAGDVELGWQKTPTSLYYHFTIPEAKYQELFAYIATYGKVKISKEKHGRVMPDGIIRLIFTVDENKK